MNQQNIYSNMNQIVSNIKPDIKFMPNGDIHLTSKVVSLLNIQEGDSIQLATDDEEVYMYIHMRNVKEKNVSGIARKASKFPNYLRIRWTSLCRKIIEMDGRAEYAAYRVGDPYEKEGHRVLPIITRKNYAAERD
jgi:ABC-type lipoprotein release transport system permease subunit